MSNPTKIFGTIYNAYINDTDNNVEIYSAEGVYLAIATWSGRELCDFEADLNSEGVAALEEAIRKHYAGE